MQEGDPKIPPEAVEVLREVFDRREPGVPDGVESEHPGHGKQGSDVPETDPDEHYGGDTKG